MITELTEQIKELENELKATLIDWEGCWFCNYLKTYPYGGTGCFYRDVCERHSMFQINHRKLKKELNI